MGIRSRAEYVLSHPHGKIAVGAIIVGLVLIVTDGNGYIGNAVALWLLSQHLRGQNASTVVESNTP